MAQLLFVKNYKENEKLRKSFNQLATDTFGIEFENWYQRGYWSDKYQPYSFIDHDKVVANVSVSLLTLVINEKEIQAVQIGTVMTHPDYRNRGLSKQLMNQVLADFKHADLIYLFANQTVLDFYPKFGFHPVEETQYAMDYSHQTIIEEPNIKKLDGTNLGDLSFVYEIAAKGYPNSRVFGAKDSEELLMFYCLLVFSQDLYYLEEEKTLVIFQIEDHELHLYEVISEYEIDIMTILNKISNSSISRVVFHYHPDYKGLLLHKAPYESNLFIKKSIDTALPKVFKHPITAQA